MITPATRRMKKAGLTFATTYFLIFFSTFYADTSLHPRGGMLWLLAALPVLPVLGVIFIFGRYLREERDEYKRELTMRVLLWGTAGCMAVVFLDGFLRIYGWNRALPPFSAFWAFAVFMLAAKFTYRMSNRMPADE